FFFCSSRRRHTRFSRDWSSDVCSSDLSIFNNEDIIRFFEDLGVTLKEEDRGRMFPVSNSAKSVLEALLKRMEGLNIEIRTNCPEIGRASCRERVKVG